MHGGSDYRRQRGPPRDRGQARRGHGAKHAADTGLAVWLCPFTNGLSIDELLDLLADCATRAERLRRGGAEIVMLTGSEVSLFTLGFFPGDTLEERMSIIADPTRVRAAIPAVRAQMSEFLRHAVQLVRARFAGRVSYASLPFEAVDWSLFDIIATDAGYRTAALAPTFRDQIRAFVADGRALGKAVAGSRNSDARPFAALAISPTVVWSALSSTRTAGPRASAANTSAMSTSRPGISPSC